MRTPDGASLYFRVHGEGAPPVALLDGLGCDGFAWRYLLPHFSARHRVLRWHYRGHGRSGIPPDPRRVGMAYTCEDLERVMDAAGLERAILFGHSMGVQVALELHRRRPERVLGLVLICGSFGYPLDTFHDHTLLRLAFPFLLGAVERFPEGSATLTRKLLRSRVMLYLSLYLELNPRLAEPRDIAPYFEHLASMDPLVFMRTLSSLKEHSAWEHLPEVDVPCLVVGGERDRFTPAWLSRRMAEAIPGAELLLVPGGSHTAPLEQPGIVADRVDRFLSAHFRL